MQISAFIKRLAKSRFRFSGVYYLSRPPFDALPLDVQFEFIYDGKSLLVQGGCPRPRGALPFSFMLEVPFESMAFTSADAELRSPQLDTLRGCLLSMGEGFEFLAAAPSGQLCSLHLQFISAHSFAVSGMLKIGVHSIGFTARETDEWDRLTAAKVVPISGRKE